MCVCVCVHLSCDCCNAGYMTTTHIKFLLTVRDGYAPQQDILQHLVAKMHAAYVGHVLNPFSVLHAPIVSLRFDQQMQTLVDAYNESVL